MATLTLKISTLSSSLDVSDANAQRVLESAFALFHQDETDEEGNAVTYTAKQRLDWIVKTLIPQMLVDKARQYEEQQTIRDAQKAAAANAARFE
jgi:uncharacterized protein YbaR (Trm112 family)